MAEIKAEQAPFVKDTIPGPPPPPPTDPTKTRARKSSLTESWAHTFEDMPVAPDQHGQLATALKTADIYGAISITAAKKFFEEMSASKPQPSDAFTKENLAMSEHDVAIPTKRLKTLRKQIVDLQREGYKPTNPDAQGRIERRGKELWKIFHKRLDELTEAELQAVLQQRMIWMVP